MAKKSINKMVNDVDLGNYSMEELIKLGDRVKEEMERKKSSVVLEARDKMHAMANGLGMTVEEVLHYNKKRKKPTQTVSKPKYRNPDDPAKTWTGRGKRPNWLLALLEKGADIENFRI